MEKKQIDWSNLGFGYVQTDMRYVSNFKDGKWDEGGLTPDANVVLNECAGVLQYAQTVFEGLKAYTTEDGHIVMFRPDLNAKRMADSARNGLSKAISKVGDLIQNGIDTQPTIRPVLDLTDVESGAGTINGIFGMRPSVGVLSNLGSINYMMNKNQNGANSDVISAIEGLGRKLGNNSGDTYNFNGITYDDGSNVADAVRTIVKAARIERRR